MKNPQLNKNGELQHLLTTEGLPAQIVRDILDRAATFLDAADGREIRKVPLLHGKSVFNVFFENSTRTRTTFEIAAKRLSADVVNLNIGSSSTSKGETLLDTVDNLCAMHADMFVVRHARMQHVADNGHTQVMEFFLVMANGEHVQQCLRGVRVAAIAGVDDMHIRRNVPCNKVRRTALRVAHHEHVGVHRAQVIHGIEQGFALAG